MGNKRMEDYRLVQGELERLISGVLDAEGEAHFERAISHTLSAGVDDNKFLPDPRVIASAEISACPIASVPVHDDVTSATVGDDGQSSQPSGIEVDIVDNPQISRLHRGDGILDSAPPRAALKRLLFRVGFENRAFFESDFQTYGVAGGTACAHVDLVIKMSGVGDSSSERDESTLLVEFHGRRSGDLSIDEAKHYVDHDVILRLQSELVPSLERPIQFLDFLLCLPLLPVSGCGWRCPVPFRLRILEDMLDQECWAEHDSDSENEGLDSRSIGGECTNNVSARSGDHEATDADPGVACVDVPIVQDQSGDVASSASRTRRGKRLRR